MEAGELEGGAEDGEGRMEEMDRPKQNGGLVARGDYVGDNGVAAGLAAEQGHCAREIEPRGLSE